MRSEKTFILGTGAQKCGTTWLYHYLSTADNVATSHLKEYHIWDALTIPCCATMLVTAQDIQQDDVKKLRFAMQHSQDVYFNYFAKMLEVSNKPITCDITPSYTGLSSATLKVIQQGFNDRNIKTKAIFLMRDPAERCWSAARMQSRNKNGHTQVDGRALLNYVTSEKCEMRTSYDKAILSLQSVFDADDLYIALYEEMYEPQKISDISAFCGVTLRPTLTENKFNESPKQLIVEDDVLRQIALHYRHVYDFVAQRFPQVEKVWRGFEYF